MDYIVTILNKIKTKFTDTRKAAFISAVVAGFLAHGYGMANNYIYHDATILNGLGITFGIGRWALAFSGMLNDLFLGNYNLPFLNVVISILFIALAAMKAVDILEVKRKATAAIIGSLMVAYPVVTSSFAYNFTASYYFFALFLVVWAVEIMKEACATEEKYPLKATYISALLFAISAGYYQAYLSVAATLFVTIMMISLYRSDDKVADVFMRGVKYVVSLLAGFALYLVLNKIFMNFSTQSVVSYQGADTLGKLEITKLPRKFIECYLHFFYIKWNGINVTKGMWALVIVAVLAAAIVIAKNFVKKEAPIANKLLFLLLCAILPIAVNLEYLFSTNELYSVHTLMRYATAFVLIIPVVLIESDRNIITNVSEMMVLALVVCYIFVNNVAYLKLNLVQEEMTSYLSVLQARIESTEGYTDETPVIFVGQFGIDDANLTKLTETYPEIQFLGFEYDAQDLLNKESWIRYMRVHSGYEPVIGEMTGDILENEEYYYMTNYPDANSVRFINGRIVVKFNEQNY